ncbi:hypothetical protein SRHO_G00316230 [Serrasalmus rhombeus]
MVQYDHRVSSCGHCCDKKPRSRRLGASLVQSSAQLWPLADNSLHGMTSSPSRVAALQNGACVMSPPRVGDPENAGTHEPTLAQCKNGHGHSGEDKGLGRATLGRLPRIR